MERGDDMWPSILSRLVNETYVRKVDIAPCICSLELESINRMKLNNSVVSLRQRTWLKSVYTKSFSSSLKGIMQPLNGT